MKFGMKKKKLIHQTKPMHQESRREEDTNEENAKKAKVDNRCPIHKRYPCNECMKREWIEAGRTEYEKKRMRERGEELDKLLEEF